MNSFQIRPIVKNDNPFVAGMIREVLEDVGAPKVGTAYEDKATDAMFEAYDADRKNYFVLEENGSIIGSAGIAPLEGANPKVCELQKMYFTNAARGRGLGSKMMEVCLDFAKKQGFAHCYLETLPSMRAAQKLYYKSGFQLIDARMGTTGHYSCEVWMLKKL